jgi:protein-S-isoprenylcysteine O-methyltransferase Ste14
MDKRSKIQAVNRKRAALKALIVLAAVAFIIFVLSHFITSREMNALKHDLSLWTVITLVIIINLVSFGCFVAMFAAWQWIRFDLKPPRNDGLDG